MGADHARRLFSLVVARARDDIAAMLGRLDGTYVGSAYVIRTGDTAGVYAVGTAPEARRRGAGGAVTAAAVEFARQRWQSEPVFLQSSEMAVSMYSELGFRTVVGYRTFGIEAPNAKTV